MIVLKDKSLLLLSASESRRCMFESLSKQYHFVLSLAVSGFPEDLPDRDCPLMYVKSTAKQKLLTFLNDNPSAINQHDIIVSADTIISFNGTVIEKPGSHSEAKELLQGFRGRDVGVITAACIHREKKIEEFVGKANILMKDYTDDAINSYLDNVPYMKMSGGIKVDAMNEMGMLRGVEGEMDVIRGFPVEQFLKIFQQA